MTAQDLPAHTWLPIESAPDDTPVLTKIDDALGSPEPPAPPGKRCCSKCGSKRIDEGGYESNGPAGWIGDGTFYCMDCDHSWPDPRIDQMPEPPAQSQEPS